MENKELNMEEMEQVSGGKRHFEPENDVPGWIQYKVAPGDTLSKIAGKYGIQDWREIRKWNPHIDEKTNMIRTGEYLWIKQ